MISDSEVALILPDPVANITLALPDTDGETGMKLSYLVLWFPKGH